jgi:hypothetical protein
MGVPSSLRQLPVRDEKPGKLNFLQTSTESRAPPGFRHVFVRAAYNRNRFPETEIVR